MKVRDLDLAAVTVHPPQSHTGYLVVTDSEGDPVGLGRAKDPFEALAPTAVISADLPVENLYRDETLSLLLINPYGAVVVDGNHILGILEHDTVSTHLHTFGADTASPARDSSSHRDAVLAGEIRTPKARLTCRCGAIVSVTIYDPDHPPTCPGMDRDPHPLQLVTR